MNLTAASQAWIIHVNSRSDWKYAKFLELKRILNIIRYTITALFGFFWSRKLPHFLNQKKICITKQNDQLNEKFKYFLVWSKRCTNQVLWVHQFEIKWDTHLKGLLPESKSNNIMQPVMRLMNEAASKSQVKKYCKAGLLGLNQIIE